jgi:hypothetical protein
VRFDDMVGWRFSSLGRSDTCRSTPSRCRKRRHRRCPVDHRGRRTWLAPIARPIEATGSFLAWRPARFSLSIGTGRASLQEAAARRHHIGDSGPTFNLGAGLLIADMVSFSVTGGAAFPSDDASFRQPVVPVEGGGEPQMVGSGLEVQSYSISAGVRTPFLVLGARSSSGSSGVAGAVFADYGYSNLVGHRSISNCIDCRNDELELTGGSFWRFGLDLALTSTSTYRLGGLSTSYQRYLSGDMINEVRIAFTYWM